jgi:hypothetical protein
MTKSKQSPRQRIARIQKFYELRGINSERVNTVQRNIIKRSLNL